MKKYNFVVEGMRCASCQSNVNNAISKLNGVISSNTNLLTGLVEVQAEDNFNPNDVIVAINSVGFKGYLKKDSGLNINLDNYFNIWELLILVILTILIMYISMSNMLYPKDPFIFDFLNHSINPLGFTITLLVLVIPIMIIGLKFYIPGIRSLIKLHPTMDSLISIGSITAFIYSFVYSILIFINPSNVHYCMNLLYEASATVICLIYLGKYIEQISTNNAKKSINYLVNLLPINANVVDKDNNIKEVCVNALNVDDVILIKAGEKLPVDGIITKGNGKLDTSLITGESEPVSVKENDIVLAGSLLLNNQLYVKASKISSDTTLNNILALVSKANINKSKITNLIDKISFYFVPIVILVSLITLVSWLFIDINKALTMFINTLVIACPCSIGLAVPLANVISSVKALKNGIVYKNSDVHHKIKKVNYVIFDKTGTLTTGKFDIEINNIYDNSYSKEQIYSILGSLEENNSHPIGKSIMRYILNNNISYIKDINKEDITSIGIKGIINNEEYYFGNYKLLNNSISDINKEYLYLIKNNKLIASIVLKDELAKNSKQLISYLKCKNINIMMLTGDNEEKAKKIANELGISNYLSELLPSDKYDIISELKQDKNNMIMYLGDGINDAPSLNLADISITPYKSSDIANESSDIYLLNDDLGLVINVFKLSKYTYNIIVLNIIWAFLYNIIAMLFATGLFVSLGLELSPYISALAMALSSICVVLTSLTIYFAFKNPKVKKHV